MLFAFLLYLTNAPAIHGRYLLNDDYPLLDNTHPRSFLEIGLRAGRPISALAWEAISRSDIDLAHARYLRLFGLCGIYLTAALVWTFLVRVDHDRLVAALVVLVVCSSPPAVLFVGWLTCVPFTIGAALSAMAALLALRPHTPARPASFPAARLVSTVLLLICSLMVYQPTAMLFWALLLVRLLRHSPSEPATETAQEMLPAALAGLTAVGAYAVLLKLAVALSGLKLAERAQASPELGLKLGWFVSRVWPEAVRLWYLGPSACLAWVMTLWILIGFASDGVRHFLVHRGLLTSLAYTAGRVSAAAILVALCFLPNLWSTDNWVAYRTMLPLMTAIVVLAIHAVQSVAALITRRLSLPATHLAVAALAVWSLAAANHHVARNLVRPQERELEYIERCISSQTGSGANDVCLIPPRPEQGLGEIIKFDEFGRPSTVLSLCGPSCVRMALRLSGKDPRVRVLQPEGCGTESLRPQGCGMVIDMRQMTP